MWPHPNKFYDLMFDLSIYWTLQMYYMPLMMYGDIDDFVTKVSLNGIKSSNLCKST